MLGNIFICVLVFVKKENKLALRLKFTDKYLKSISKLILKSYRMILNSIG